MTSEIISHGCRHFDCYYHGLQAICFSSFSPFLRSSPNTGFSGILSVGESTTHTCTPHTFVASFSRYFSEVTKSWICRGQEVASLLKILTWSSPCSLRRGGSLRASLMIKSLWKSTSHLAEHRAGFDEPICSCVSHVAFFMTLTNSRSPWPQLFAIGITLICISSGFNCNCNQRSVTTPN